MKAARNKSAELARADDAEDNMVLDTILEKLRNPENLRRKRSRPSTAKVPAPLALADTGITDTPTGTASSADTTDTYNAKDMLAALKMDMFDAFRPTSPRPGRSGSALSRRSRLRAELGSVDGDNDGKADVLSDAVPEEAEDAVRKEDVDDSKEELAKPNSGEPSLDESPPPPPPPPKDVETQ